LESAVTKERQQVIDIMDATLVTAIDNSVALRIGDLLIHTKWHELILRAERLTLIRGDGQDLGIAGLLKMGGAYWEAFEQQRTGVSSAEPGGDSNEKSP
jgi:hypothetical protein